MLRSGITALFLSALREVEKRTTLRPERTSGDRTGERFFDYAPAARTWTE